MRGIVTTLLASDEVPQENRLGFAAGERIAGLSTGAGVRLVGVLTSEADCEFSEAQARIRAGAAIPL
ncbi:hypothetical protein ACFQ6H_14355 [Rhodococcus sp. NPDC056506]|uniref:hypothetical protein n=1 Tax=Rhodococcus sp. NPDC056506 TaxID=3345844 RepID=UPI00367149CB